jgi:peptidoglycan/LPS O-acetylase OafA/YrhL
MKYIKQLDSIRGIGIILVVLFHWLPVDSFYNTFPNRPFGVDVFFVLSGFLITQILLVARREGEIAGIPKKSIFINFYLRRALRIFPIYYITVSLVILSHHWLDASIQGEPGPMLTYTLNFHFYNNKYWGDLTTHLWTLSIEEQFYLVWPWIILLINKRLVPYAIGVFTLAGMISQGLIVDQEFGYLPTNTCFDAFGIGAAMAWVKVDRNHHVPRMYTVLRAVGIVSALVLLFAAVTPDLFFLAPQRTVRSLVAAWAICFIILKDHKNELSTAGIFNNRLLIFIGKISYGMYLFHIFFPWMYYNFNDYINRWLPEQWSAYLFPITIIENFLMLILISWLSWRFIERPILGLKKHAALPNTAGNKPALKNRLINLPFIK